MLWIYFEHLYVQHPNIKFRFQFFFFLDFEFHLQLVKVFSHSESPSAADLGSFWNEKFVQWVISTDTITFEYKYGLLLKLVNIFGNLHKFYVQKVRELYEKSLRETVLTTDKDSFDLVLSMLMGEQGYNPFSFSVAFDRTSISSEGLCLVINSQMIAYFFFQCKRYTQQ